MFLYEAKKEEKKVKVAFSTDQVTSHALIGGLLDESGIPPPAVSTQVSNALEWTPV